MISNFHRSTNADHQIHNQQISINTLSKTYSPDIEDNPSRGAFWHVREQLARYDGPKSGFPDPPYIGRNRGNI